MYLLQTDMYTHWKHIPSSEKPVKDTTEILAGKS